MFLYFSGVFLLFSTVFSHPGVEDLFFSHNPYILFREQIRSLPVIAPLHLPSIFPSAVTLNLVRGPILTQTRTSGQNVRNPSKDNIGNSATVVRSNGVNTGGYSDSGTVINLRAQSNVVSRKPTTRSLLRNEEPNDVVVIDGINSDSNGAIQDNVPTQEQNDMGNQQTPAPSYGYGFPTTNAQNGPRTIFGSLQINQGVRSEYGAPIPTRNVNNHIRNNNGGYSSDSVTSFRSQGIRSEYGAPIPVRNTNFVVNNGGYANSPATSSRTQPLLQGIRSDYGAPIPMRNSIPNNLQQSQLKLSNILPLYEIQRAPFLAELRSVHRAQPQIPLKNAVTVNANQNNLLRNHNGGYENGFARIVLGERGRTLLHPRSNFIKPISQNRGIFAQSNSFRQGKDRAQSQYYTIRYNL